MQNTVILLNPEKEKCSILFTFTSFFFFLLLTYSCRTGSLVAFVSAALKAASRLAIESSVRDLLPGSMSAFAAAGQSNVCVPGDIPLCPGHSGYVGSVDLQDVSWLCQGTWAPGGGGWSGDLWSASSLGCFLGIRIRGAFDGLGKWMCVELHELVEEIEGRHYQLN